MQVTDCCQIYAYIYVYAYAYAYIYIYLYLYSYLSEFHFFKTQELIQSWNEMFHFRIKWNVSFQIQASFGMKVEVWSRTLHLESSDLAFPEWLLLLFTSEAAKTETTEKNILVLTKLHLFFFRKKMDSINRYWLVLLGLHTAIKVYPQIPAKNWFPLLSCISWICG